jgi:hypothetical protein
MFHEWYMTVKMARRTRPVRPSRVSTKVMEIASYFRTSGNVPSIFCTVRIS